MVSDLCMCVHLFYVCECANSIVIMRMWIQKQSDFIVKPLPSLVSCRGFAPLNKKFIFTTGSLRQRFIHEHNTHAHSDTFSVHVCVCVFVFCCERAMVSRDLTQTTFRYVEATRNDLACASFKYNNRTGNRMRTTETNICGPYSIYCERTQTHTHTNFTLACKIMFSVFVCVCVCLVIVCM